MDERRLLRILAISLLAVNIANADNYTKDFIDNETLSELKEKIENIKPSAEAKAQAKRLYDILFSDGFGLIESEMSRLTESLNVSVPEEILTPKKEDIEIIIFISESVPTITLKNYIKAADAGTQFVLRGTVGKDPSKLMPTLKFIRDLLCEDDNCTDANIIIDPALFREYAVTRAPTTVIKKEGEVYKFVGAMPVSYVLEKIGR
jgi:type-F conjugative transfer system pilin assembly protein TrbC